MLIYDIKILDEGALEIIFRILAQQVSSSKTHWNKQRCKHFFSSTNYRAVDTQWLNSVLGRLWNHCEVAGSI